MVNESFELPSIYEFIENKKIDKIFEDFLLEASKKQPSIEASTIDEFKLISAIESRNYIGIYYEEPSDEDEKIVKKGFRLCEPYVYGLGYRYKGKRIHRNRAYLRVFVIRDTEYDPLTEPKFKTKRKSASKTKRVPYWRLLRVDRIAELSIIPKKFSTYRELYNPDDKVIASIITSASKDDFPKGESKLKLPKELRDKVREKKKLEDTE